jgi:hypothetical protein
MKTGRTAWSIDKITNSLKAYMNDGVPARETILFEQYHVPFAELEPRTDIRFARIAVYEQNEQVTDQINDWRADMSIVNIGIDISVIRAYSKDNHTRGETPLLNLKDEMIEWAKTVQVAGITDAYLLALGFGSGADAIRNDKFVSRTFTFQAKRDLHRRQVFLETFDQTFDETFA